jgi:hypothetical protein
MILSSTILYCRWEKTKNRERIFRFTLPWISMKEQRRYSADGKNREGFR